MGLHRICPICYRGLFVPCIVYLISAGRNRTRGTGLLEFPTEYPCEVRSYMHLHTSGLEGWGQLSPHGGARRI